MHLNIAQKIFGIAVVVLALMAMVAVYSIRLTAEISDELDALVDRQLPLSNTIGRINVRILEQGILLQQLFVLHDESPESIARIKALGDEVNVNFARAKVLFEEEEHSNHPVQSIFTLEESLANVENEYRQFEQHGLDLLALHAKGDTGGFMALLPDLNRQQNTIDEEIANLHIHMENVAYEAVKLADENEEFLLYFNASMTSLAAVLGLWFASAVTLLLARNIRALVRGTEQVEEGSLDTEVPVATRDEIGKLTASFNKMVAGLRLKERIKDTFGKYMDPRIVTNLLESPELTRLGGDRREMTVMFIDLKDYTSISEKLSAPDLVRMINVFFGHMVDAISANSGVINDFQGDAVMAYWGPPFSHQDEHATLACKAALAALENFEKFRDDLRAELRAQADEVNTDLRIGISSGEMVVGNIGSTEMRKFSVIGDPVNLGARLEGANKNYGTRVMISERTRDLAGTDIHVRELDLIRVKGKAEPTRVFELLSKEPRTSRLQAGLAAYRNQEWEVAAREFEACRVDDPADPVPNVFLERIAYLNAHHPSPDWDGVWVFETK